MIERRSFFNFTNGRTLVPHSLNIREENIVIIKFRIFGSFYCFLFLFIFTLSLFFLSRTVRCKIVYFTRQRFVRAIIDADTSQSLFVNISLNFRYQPSHFVHLVSYFWFLLLFSFSFNCRHARRQQGSAKRTVSHARLAGMRVNVKSPRARACRTFLAWINYF